MTDHRRTARVYQPDPDSRKVVLSAEMPGKRYWELAGKADEKGLTIAHLILDEVENQIDEGPASVATVPVTREQLWKLFEEHGGLPTHAELRERHEASERNRKSAKAQHRAQAKADIRTRLLAGETSSMIARELGVAPALVAETRAGLKADGVEFITRRAVSPRAKRQKAAREAATPKRRYNRVAPDIRRLLGENVPRAEIASRLGCTLALVDYHRDRLESSKAA